ncbi:hypothetical protein NMG60_11018048 [Bertholletia excelsa]
MEDAKVQFVAEELDPENGSICTETDNRDHHDNLPDPSDLRGRALSFTKSYRSPVNKPKSYNAMQTMILAYQSLGIVYGDISNSFLNVTSSLQLPEPSEENLLGVLSLITWTITLLVLVKYVFIVIQADDNGEGGTFALYSLLSRQINFRTKFTIQNPKLDSDESMRCYTSGSTLQSKTKKFLESSLTAQSILTFVVLLGTCMVIGDGALTAATAVLPALQGILASSPKITQGYVVLMALVLLVALFAFQRCGTSKVAFSFSPIMVVWFVSNASIGIYNIVRYHPSILRGLSPHYVVKFFLKNGKTGWDFLGTAFMSITGAEAMFADLGHFNKRAIQVAFTFFVFPTTVLTYAGIAAYLVQHPDKINNAYYGSVPETVYWPMFVLSTLAAIVSSQSMISAIFSLIKQSLAHDCFPRVKIIHTSSEHEGQVYCPEVNYIVMILCVGLVLGFKDGAALSNAYGVVVIWVMIITTCLATLVMLVVWDTNFLLACGFFFPCIILEGIFMSSLVQKIPQGGWVSVAISVFFLTIMLSWTYGRSRRSLYESKKKMSLLELNQLLSSPNLYRSPGICLFYTDLVNGIPPIIRRYIQHTCSIHEIMVVVTLRTLPIKTVLQEERFVVGRLAREGVYSCLVQFGYNDKPDTDGDDYLVSMVGKLRELAETTSEKQKLDSAVEKGSACVMGRTILRASKENGWFARFAIDYLYRFLQKNCRAAISVLQVPREKTVQVGMLYEI